MDIIIRTDRVIPLLSHPQSKAMNASLPSIKRAQVLPRCSPKDKKEELLSQLIGRLNELFIIDELTDKDMVNYAHAIRDKVRENILVMNQISTSSPEQAMLGDFPKGIDDAIMGSSEAHQNQMMQLLSDPEKVKGFAKVVFELLSQ